MAASPFPPLRFRARRASAKRCLPRSPRPSSSCRQAGSLGLAEPPSHHCPARQVPRRFFSLDATMPPPLRLCCRARQRHPPSTTSGRTRPAASPLSSPVLGELKHPRKQLGQRLLRRDSPAAGGAHPRGGVLAYAAGQGDGRACQTRAAGDPESRRMRARRRREDGAELLHHAPLTTAESLRTTPGWK